MTDGERLRVLRVIARMNTGGPARQVMSLARHLDPTRFEHRLLVGSVEPDEADDLDLRAAHVEHRRVRGLGRALSPLDDARALASLVAEIRRFRPHLVHTHTAKAGVLGRVAALAAAVTPEASRPALVHTFHGHLLHGYFSPRATKAVVAVEKGLGRETDRLVAVGERVRDELVAAGVGRAGQWSVVAPGIELGPVPGRAEARARLGLADEAPVVAFVARLCRVKRPDRFVEVAARVAAARPATCFVVAGGGELADDVRARVNAAGLCGQVSLLGWFADIEAVYAAADVVVLCSDNEGMPVSLVEAALVGRPAVTTDVGSAAEVVEHGRTGLVVDSDPGTLALAVVSLLDDGDRAAALGAAAAERAGRLFSAARLAADHAVIYEEVVAARAPSGHTLFPVPALADARTPEGQGPLVRVEPWPTCSVSPVAGDSVDELDLRGYLRVVRRRKWILALVTLVVVGSAIGASVLQTPVYQGTAEVLLQAKATESLFDPNSGQRNDPTRVVQTEIQVLKSRPVSDLVRRKLGSSPPVSASPVGGTDVIEVKAESTDPDRAADVANAYAESYIAFRRTQAVDDVLAAAEQIQQKVAELQTKIDGVGAPTATVTTLPGAPRAAPAADTTQERDQLVAQQALFRQKLDQLQVDAALKSGGAQLVTPAVAPTTPIRPTPVRNGVLAVVVGLMLGLGLAFLREHLDDTIRTKEDVERAAGGLAVLATIPVVPGWKDRRKAVVASLVEPKSAAAEAYRSLRTSVQFLGLDRPVRTLQVTSPSASEGKTSTVANLAVALAGAGQRVIAVDCDLRKPRLHAFFGLENEVGFTSVLLGDAPLSAALQPAPGVDGLLVLASGAPPPNPSELLAGPRSARVIEDLQAQADVVLIDCPPVLPVTDAAILAGRVDATLVVVTAVETHRRRLGQALEALAQVGAPLSGLVLNAARQEAGYGYAYRYGYTYSSQPRQARGVRKAGRKAEQPADS